MSTTDADVLTAGAWSLWPFTDGLFHSKEVWYRSATVYAFSRTLPRVPRCVRLILPAVHSVQYSPPEVAGFVIFLQPAVSLPSGRP